jgi:hypothetical protein
LLIFYKFGENDHAIRSTSVIVTSERNLKMYLPVQHVNSN